MKIGVDVVCVAQIARALALSATFPSRAYSLDELNATKQMTSKRRSEFLAGRFAIKQAGLKIMRAGPFGQVSLTNIETTVAPDGMPELVIASSSLKSSCKLPECWRGLKRLRKHPHRLRRPLCSQNSHG